MAFPANLANLASQPIWLSGQSDLPANLASQSSGLPANLAYQHSGLQANRPTQLIWPIWPTSQSGLLSQSGLSSQPGLPSQSGQSGLPSQYGQYGLPAKMAHTQFSPETALARYSLRPRNTSARNTLAWNTSAQRIFRPAYILWPGNNFSPENTSAYILWPRNTSTR